MREIILQSWANSNMAGDAWRWEVYAVFNAGYWSVRGRQIDEITGKVYRVAGAYRLKSIRAPGEIRLPVCFPDEEQKHDGFDQPVSPGLFE